MFRARFINTKTSAENHKGEPRCLSVQRFRKSLKTTGLSALMFEDPFKFQVFQYRHAPKNFF